MEGCSEGTREEGQYGKKLRSMCTLPPRHVRGLGAVLEAEGSQAWERGPCWGQIYGGLQQRKKEKPEGSWRGAASEGEWRSRKGVSS